MDAAGKDSVVKHVMSGINPQGCEVHAFKAPSAEELEHDFLWRIDKALPERGHIGIFNRSHYEEVLIVRVHPEILRRGETAAGATGKTIWKHRFKDIRAFEHHLQAQRHAGTEIPFTHFEGRTAPALPGAARRAVQTLEVFHERRRRARHWDKYMAAYQDMIRETSTDYAPWYVVPSDHKHITWVIVSAAIVEALDKLKLDYPKVTGKALKELKACKRALKAAGNR